LFVVSASEVSEVVARASTRLRPRGRWLLPEEPDPAIVAQLKDELRLPHAVCRLLAIRGLGEPDHAKAYLRPRLDHLH
jgi:hypothetical protein